MSGRSRTWLIPSGFLLLLIVLVAANTTISVYFLCHLRHTSNISADGPFNASSFSSMSVLSVGTILPSTKLKDLRILSSESILLSGLDPRNASRSSLELGRSLTVRGKKVTFEISGQETNVTKISVTDKGLDISGQHFQQTDDSKILTSLNTENLSSQSGMRIESLSSSLNLFSKSSLNVTSVGGNVIVQSPDTIKLSAKNKLVIDADRVVVKGKNGHSSGLASLSVCLCHTGQVYFSDVCTNSDGCF